MGDRTMGNYLTFVDDNDFLECVEILVEAYVFQENSVNIEKELKYGKNTTDFVKVLFDVFTQGITLKEWAENEVRRRNDKTINNKIGEFHQNLLGKVPGWINLETGDKSGLDLKKEDNSIFIELKNKYNTLNKNSTLAMRENLENILEEYPTATVYWAYVIEKKYSSKNEIWEYYEKIKNSNEHVIHYDKRIKVISGNELYTLVTGDSSALTQLLSALPNAINYILMDRYNVSDTALSKKEQELLDDYINFVLNG